MPFGPRLADSTGGLADRGGVTDGGGTPPGNGADGDGGTIVAAEVATAALAEAAGSSTGATADGCEVADAGFGPPTVIPSMDAEFAVESETDDLVIVERPLGTACPATVATAALLPGSTALAGVTLDGGFEVLAIETGAESGEGGGDCAKEGMATQ